MKQKDKVLTKLFLLTLLAGCSMFSMLDCPTVSSEDDQCIPLVDCDSDRSSDAVGDVIVAGQRNCSQHKSINATIPLRFGNNRTQ
jgi:hypothetical protein